MSVLKKNVAIAARRYGRYKFHSHNVGRRKESQRSFIELRKKLKSENAF